MTAWRIAVNRTHSLLALPLLVLSSSSLAFAQEPEGPQTSAPAPIAPAARPALVRRVGGNDKVMVPAGTRVAVVLENGISTPTAKAAHSLYFLPSFPIPPNHPLIIPVGSFL